MVGSELPKRVVVGVGIGAVIILAIFTHPIFLLLVTILWVGLASRELLSILERKGIYLSPYLFIPLNLLFPIFKYLRLSIPGLIFGSSLLVLIYLIFFEKPVSWLSGASASFFTCFYLGWLPAHLIALSNLGLSPWQILFPFLLTWLNDTAAYGIGSAFGRHRLAPKISPKKSWEGVVGGVGFSVAAAIFYGHWCCPGSSMLAFIIMGLLWGWVALWGDLLESGFKRDVGLKDSSHLLPGHGGFLDRIDSLLFTIPFYYYYILHILKLLPSP